MNGISRKLTRLLCVLIAAVGSSFAQRTTRNAASLIPSPLKNVIRQLRGIAVQIDFGDDPVDAVPRGSGFWINDSGYIATCWHVVKDVPTGKLIALTPTENNFEPSGGVFRHANWMSYYAKLVAKNEQTDIAILKLDETVSTVHFPKRGSAVRTGIGPAYLQVATLGDRLPEAGTSAVLIGFPLGEPYDVAQTGAVASTAFNIPGFGPTVKVLVSTVANPGNSGGPVFDDQGKVLGLLEGSLIAHFGPTPEVSGLAIVVPVQELAGLAKKNNITIHH